ncbi:MAG: response regulator, partial [Flavobacteriales bacterium]|nr:response regulator [Flavobacteriales bacterium]
MNDFGLQDGDRRTVLVVDDSVQNLQLLTALLKDIYRIKVAKNGAKAVEITANDPTIDLILMDVIMPEMNGYEACQHIKENDSTAHIPVIFLTALTDVSDETKGFEVGGADFISKPFNAEVVKARIKTHIELQHERKKSDLLLAYLLPDAVIQELKTTGSYAPVIHQNTSIMFCDLVDFTTIASKLEPTELVSELTDLFTQFDKIVTNNNGFRVKTLGDGYMTTTGISNSKDEDHAT